MAAANSKDYDDLYTYDGLQRLKNFDRGDLTGMPYSGISGTPTDEQDWTLDQLGNWPGFIKKAAGTITLDQTRYHNAVNEIDGNSGNSITASTGTNWADPAYDTAGNMTTMPKPADLANGFTLKYDAWNQLVEVKDGGTTVQTNEYDGLGRRIQKVAGGVTYHYFYNEQWQLVYESNGTSSDIYAWHPYYIDALAARFHTTNGNSFTSYYYLQDANFNVTAVTDDTGAVLERYKYSPYGEVTVLNADFSLDSSGGDGLTDIGNTHFYTGRELDPESGLQLNRNRFYTNHLGRWLTRDPIGYSGSEWNLYEYVNSRPIAMVDPKGKFGYYSKGCVTLIPPRCRLVTGICWDRTQAEVDSLDSACNSLCCDWKYTLAPGVYESCMSICICGK